ncbi:MAG TPA: hypothetical protein VMB51_03855 [Solirubrobacteraceae bacterium]|nr:hypothetical protein [Solirubrobacteraceae bacterium]
MQRPAIRLTALAALIMVGLVITLVGLGHAPGVARAQANAPADPPANLPLGPLPASCAQAPSGPACEEAIVAALDGARGRLGLGPYELPHDFTSLAPARQLLVLTDLDRVAYGLAPVAGLNAELDQSARAGVEQLSDPLPPPELTPGVAVWGFASNWASDYPNALAAYYVWMYDDGYGSANAACTSPGAEGCWGHRQDILWRFPEGWLAMGAATGIDVYGTPSVAMLIAYTRGAQSPTDYYAWNPTATVASTSKRPSGRCAVDRARRAARVRSAHSAGARHRSKTGRAGARREQRARDSRAGRAPTSGACAGRPGSG